MGGRAEAAMRRDSARRSRPAQRLWRFSNMPRRALAARWIVVAGLAFGASGATAQAAPGEDSRTAEKFLRDLRDRGLHDLALDFIRLLRADQELPAKVKDVLDYE